MTYYPGFNPGPHEGYLPEQVPEEFFNDPFWAKVAEKFWEDDSLEQPTEAIVPVASTLDTDQLLQLAQLIENDFPERDDGCMHLGNIWQGLKDIQTDDKGVVRAEIGHASDVLSYLKDQEDQAPTDLNEIIEAQIFSAAHKYRGAEFAAFLSEMLRLEPDYRLELSRLSPEERQTFQHPELPFLK